MSENMEHFNEWNTAKEPSFTHLPVKRMLAMLQAGKEQAALYEYCRATSGGLAEAKSVLAALKKGAQFFAPYGYTGWKTGGIPIFWCSWCKTAQPRTNVSWTGVQGDWDHEDVYFYICQTCKKSATKEFHWGQFEKALDKLKASTIPANSLSPFYTERIGLGLTEALLVKTLAEIATQTYKKFCEGLMPLPAALEFESALENPDKFLEYLTHNGAQVFDKVMHDVLAGQESRLY